jgi:ADP-ribosylglycohydrolase
MTFPGDYVERVYAGVLGKIIGVYLGRPVENLSYEQIMAELGEIRYYVNQQRGFPLIVTDDDISGTFTFLRALPDHGYTLQLTAEQIGWTWLNYLIEQKTVLWWGGFGNSSEHTAYLRLKHGIPAPRSGSAQLNGSIIANQIGAQIFIDGWALVSPGDPEGAASLARKAASVSHDQDAIYAAQVLAAMEAQAFVESDINHLIDTGVNFIPKDSIIYRMIGDIREWHAQDHDWRKTRERIAAQYGYKDFGGNVHVVPNHALIILGLLYGSGDFNESLMITNTCGWDADCNSGNIGCLLGIRNGLAGLDGTVDWRGPVSDRMFLPTADGGRCVTDALTETYHIVNIARTMNSEPVITPKGGAQFHFELPGSVQGFQVTAGSAAIQNAAGHSKKGERSLQITVNGGGVVRIQTGTFPSPEDLKTKSYEMVASPTLYPGQEVFSGVWCGEQNAAALGVRLAIAYYDGDDQPVHTCGEKILLAPGDYRQLRWAVPKLFGQPVYAVGLEIEGQGTLFLDDLGWHGVPSTVFSRPKSSLPWPGGLLWRFSWVNAMDQWDYLFPDAFRLTQNEGRGLVITGKREWQDYQVSARVRPTIAKAAGIALRIQGLRRFYALQLTGDATARLLKVMDQQETVLGEQPFAWQEWQEYDISLEATGSRMRGWVEDRLLFDIIDNDNPLTEGALGLVLEEGHMVVNEVKLNPVF